MLIVADGRVPTGREVGQISPGSRFVDSAVLGRAQYLPQGVLGREGPQEAGGTLAFRSRTDLPFKNALIPDQ